MLAHSSECLNLAFVVFGAVDDQFATQRKREERKTQCDSEL